MGKIEYVNIVKLQYCVIQENKITGT